MIKPSFYCHYAADPFYNMAFDEWMFARVCARPESVALRLYTWNPAAITFGYNQRIEVAVDHAQLGDTPLIRRVTGGRALYHDRSELTYSIAINDSESASPMLAGSVARTSEQIARVLVAFLSRLGIDSDYVRQSFAGSPAPDDFHSAPCFASSARSELVSGGSKVVASAQRRLQTTLFQHGSIKINGLASHAALRFTGDSQTFEPTIPVLKQTNFDSTCELFVDEFSRFFECPVERMDVCDADRKEVLVRKKYVEEKCLIRRDIFAH